MNAHKMVSEVSDADLTRKIKKTCEKITENLYVAANEPTLACFRIQEHVHKTAPMLLEKAVEMQRTEHNLKGLLYDVEYSQASMDSYRSSQGHFESIHQLLKQAIFYKQQADYNESIKRRVSERLQQQQQASPKKSTPEPSAPPPSTSSSTPAPSTTLNRARNFHHRFSTSFDFPVGQVASSVSADLKSLISQLAQSSMSSTKGQDSSRPSTPKVATSKSLHTLQESAAEKEEDKESSCTENQHNLII